MINVLEIFDQFTTTWAKARANLLSHVIALFLLWLIGFRPPLPRISTDDVANLTGNPLHALLGDVGWFALVSLGVVLAIGVYTILLREVGRIALNVFLTVFPPRYDSNTVKLSPRRALLTIAATLDSGERYPDDISRQSTHLFAEYSQSKPADVQKLLSAYNELQKEANTHVRNALVFFLAWFFAPWFLPDHDALAIAIAHVYWSGLFVLVLYLIIARARLISTMNLTSAQMASVVATLVLRDERFQDELANARFNPKPYRDLVDQLLLEAERQDTRPSLRAFLRNRLQTSYPGLVEPLSGKWTRELSDTLSEMRSFGYSQENRDYSQKDWFLRYLGWRLARAARRVQMISHSLLAMIGIYRL